MTAVHNCISGRVGIKQKANPIPIKQKLLLVVVRVGVGSKEREGGREEERGVLPDKDSCRAGNVFEGNGT